MLLRIAGFDCLQVQEQSEQVVYLPSKFPADAVPRAGSIFLITKTGACLPQRLMNRMALGRCTVLCCEKPEGAQRAGLRGVTLSSLRKGGGSQ
jgi:hypothetical protein